MQAPSVIVQISIARTLKNQKFNFFIAPKSNGIKTFACKNNFKVQLSLMKNKGFAISSSTEKPFHRAIPVNGCV